VTHRRIVDQLNHDLAGLAFGPPVVQVYNPLHYARDAYLAYAERYGAGLREVVLLGMNPGPWGMAQTGVPFGEVAAVTGWLDLRVPVRPPGRVHPRRPIEGLACRRSEVSGRRLWGWARETFGTPERFLGRFFVANYCPLIFMEASGRNRTPDQLPAAQRRPLESVCNRALVRLATLLEPRHVIGVGRFAADRARAALAGTGIRVGQITHPSPANPLANRGWGRRIEGELADLGILLGTALI
jgi:single-strand selective monofunctional uracil DNA glycosylase